MESIPQKIRRVGCSIFMLLHLFLLFNNILFFHSHWYNGDLVAVHAHPYDFDSNLPIGQDDGSHSKEELDLYDLISNTPSLELGFYEFFMRPFKAESDAMSVEITLTYEESYKSQGDIRGPPALC